LKTRRKAGGGVIVDFGEASESRDSFKSLLDDHVYVGRFITLAAE
jgi:hypothetical protein